MDTKSTVIAISAISGGGKSTVVHTLVELLDDAVAIHFDEYETPDTYPTDPVAMVAGGVDFNAIKSPLLVQHLQALRRGESITSPATGEMVSPARYIIFEGPLGRAQQATGKYIDYLIFIDTPLEVGLARRFARSISTSELENMTRDELIAQLTYLDWLADSYLLWMRKVYLAQLELVRPASDLIVDGEQPVGDLAKVIIDALAEAKFLK